MGTEYSAFPVSEQGRDEQAEALLNIMGPKAVFQGPSVSRWLNCWPPMFFLRSARALLNLGHPTLRLIQAHGPDAMRQDPFTIGPQHHDR